MKHLEKPHTVIAWHQKYINVDVAYDAVVYEQDEVSLIINISYPLPKQPGEKDYPFDIKIQRDSLEFIPDKISETRYKHNLSALVEGVNNVSIRILESGCPPYNFPFEITYVKPVEKSFDQPAVEGDVKIKRKENAKKSVSKRRDTPMQIPVDLY